MHKLYLILIMASSALLFGCKELGKQGSSGYSQVQPGMSYAQVVKILNKPTRTSDTVVDGVPAKSASWHKKNGIIVIEFLDDKVEIKTMNNIGAPDVDNS